MNRPEDKLFRAVLVYGAGVRLITVGCGWVVVTGGGGAEKLHTRLMTMLRISRSAKTLIMI
jgi:hypothetical protein